MRVVRFTKSAPIILGLALGLAGLGVAFGDTVAPPPPPQAPPLAPKPAPSAPVIGTQAMIVDHQTMDAIVGKSIKSPTGDDLGRLVDMLIAPNGQVRAAVIDFGGVLGVGSRKIAVDWRALDFSDSEKSGFIKLVLTRDQIRVAPEYRSGEPVVIMEPSRAEEPAAVPAVAKPAMQLPPATPPSNTPATPSVTK